MRPFLPYLVQYAKVRYVLRKRAKTKTVMLTAAQRRLQGIGKGGLPTASHAPMTDTRETATEHSSYDASVQEQDEQVCDFSYSSGLSDQSVKFHELAPNGCHYIRKVREALETIDNCGWNRSYHQRMFHEQYLKASVRCFFKLYPPGSFQRFHQKILMENGWDTLPQEILVSTPRRFGKTISVSMFCAAMVFSSPGIEISIYSTCKRISQALLKKVCLFLDLLFEKTKTPKFKVIRQNQEELVLMGGVSRNDTRCVSSYPSKVIPHQPLENS